MGDFLIANLTETDFAALRKAYGVPEDALARITPQERARIRREIVKYSADHGVWIAAALEDVALHFGANRPSRPLRFGMASDMRRVETAANAWNWQKIGVVYVAWCEDKHEAERLYLSVRVELERADGFRVRHGSKWHDMALETAVRIVHEQAGKLGIDIRDNEAREAKIAHDVLLAWKAEQRKAKWGDR